MGMAAALSVIVWRLLRDDRRRSEARVLALTSAAVPRIPPKGGNDTDVARDTSFKDSPVASAFGRSSASDLPLHATEAPVVTGALFVEPAASSPWGNRFAVMAGLALIGASAVLFAMTASKTRAPAPAGTALSAPAAEQSAVGLELLSLRDARTPDSLTITGMVQNPRAGSLLTRVAVTAYAFDDKGAFLASGRALLDVTSLAPGDESPFVVTVPVTESVARYRIGFRGEDGRVIAHVDKRQQGPIAANW
jgi:hypothetical protein